METHLDMLVETLTNAGVVPSEAGKVKVLAWAGAEAAENERVHSSTNSIISDLLRKDALGHCVHVTGGARALTDPYHRQICVAMRDSAKDPFEVLYHVPQPANRSPWCLVEWTLSQWGRKGFSGWRQKLLTLDMIGTGAVNLHGYDERSRIQYSVFGNRYVQVQGHHSDDALAKYVWLIDSKAVNRTLLASADADLTRSVDVATGEFADFVSCIYSNAARVILFEAVKAGQVESASVIEDDLLISIAEDPAVVVNALKIMSFLREDADGVLTPTVDARSFAETL